MLTGEPGAGQLRALTANQAHTLLFKIKTELKLIPTKSSNIQYYSDDGLKELSLCHKLGILNPNFFKTKCRRP